MNIKLLANILVSSLLLTSVAYGQQRPNNQPAALVEVDAVKSELVAQTIWVPGTVLSHTDSNLAAEVAGRIIWIADVGTKVLRGETLVKLDDRRLRLTLGQEKANISKWQSRVDMLEKRLARFSSMEARQNTSKDQLDEVEAELEIATAERDQAKLSYELTAYQLEQTHIQAPFDAIVVEQLQSNGEYTTIGQNLLRVVNPNKVEASVRAPLTALPFVEAGMEVTVKDKMSRQQEIVKSVVPVGNSTSRMMEIRVALEPDDFAIGSAVRVALPHSEARMGRTVPRDALVLRKSGTYVYEVNENLEAKQIAVTTGVGKDDRIEVFGELAEQSRVVVRGAERLRTGQKVRIHDNSAPITVKKSEKGYES